MMKTLRVAQEQKKERNINTISKEKNNISTHVLSVDTFGVPSHQNDIIERLLNRQAIYDSSGRITAIELIPRIRWSNHEQSIQAQSLRQSDDTTLIAGLCSLTENEKQPPHPLLVNIDAVSLGAKEIDLLPRQHVIFTLDILPGAITLWLPQIKKRRREGFRLLINYRNGMEIPAALADLIKQARIDVGLLNAAEMETVSKALRLLGMQKLIAANIGCQETFDLCVKLKFDGFQGTYCDEMPDYVLPPTEINRLRLLELIDRVIARHDLAEIESQIHTDARLSYQLIAYTNTLNSNETTINSLTQAFQQLKHAGLYRWLTLLLHTSTAPRPDSLKLLKRGLSRAFFLETLARKSLQQVDPQAAYLIGLFSVIGSLLNLPLEQAISRLKLSAQIKTALIEQKGTGGLMLKLASAAENNDQQAIENLAARCLVSSVDVNLAMINALVLTETTPL
ncbi:MAG: EAL and HDOD domain-containing protein [Burkholderiales bacterium]